MNRLHTVFRVTFLLVILFVLLIPSIALADLENVTSTEIDNNYLNKVSVSETTTQAANSFGESSESKQATNDHGFQSLLFKIIAGLSVLTTGIIAGTVFAYANSVMPGLRNSDDRTFVLSIRHLTSSVANPVFLIFSNGALIAQLGFVVLAVSLQQFDQVILGSIALFFYVATLLITFLGNLPLNKAIISTELPKNDSDWNALRVRFEARWTFLNHSRTLTCILSVSLLLVALLIG